MDNERYERKIRKKLRKQKLKDKKREAKEVLRSEKMAEKGGIGLAESIFHALTKGQGHV